MDAEMTRGRTVPLGAWLGVLLLVIGHAVAQSTILAKVTPPRTTQGNNNTILGKVHSEIRNEENATTTIIADRTGATTVYPHIFDSEENPFENSDFEAETNDPQDNTTSRNSDTGDASTRTSYYYTTPLLMVEVPTIATIDFEKHITSSIYEEEAAEPATDRHKIIKSEKLGRYTATTKPIFDEILNERLHDDGGRQLTTTLPEFESTDEYENFDEHTSYELSEATTPKTTTFDERPQRISENSRKNIEDFEIGNSDDYDVDDSDKDVISLANDTNINYNNYYGILMNKNFGSNSKNMTIVTENGTTVMFSNSSVIHSEYGPKHQVEVFKNVTHPLILRVSESTGADTGVSGTDHTTPVSVSPKSKARTIAFSTNNVVSTSQRTVILPVKVNHTDSEHATSDVIPKIFPKKTVTTEKPIELKPYPYVKTDNNHAERAIMKMTYQTEESTEEISAYENTIGRKKSDEKIIVTEPSVLLENSIQQFKPIHYKRSGNASRVNSTFDLPPTATAWALPITKDVKQRNVTGTTEKYVFTTTKVSGEDGKLKIPDADNDVPQVNPEKSITTERIGIVVSEVTENHIEANLMKANDTNKITTSAPTSSNSIELKSIPEEEVTKHPSTVISTNKPEKVSNNSSRSNEIQSENEDSKLIRTQFNVTEVSTEYPLTKDNFTIKPEEVSNNTSKSNEIQSENEDSKLIRTQFNVTEASTEYPLTKDNFTIGEDTTTRIVTTELPNLSEEQENTGMREETTTTLGTTISTTQSSRNETTSTTQNSRNETTSTTAKATTGISEETLITGSGWTETRQENITKRTEGITSTPGKENVSTIPGNVTNTTEPMDNLTTTVEYEFIELTEAGQNTTASQNYVASSEKGNTFTDSPEIVSKTTTSDNVTEDVVSVDGDKTETTVSFSNVTIAPRIEEATVPTTLNTEFVTNSEPDMTTTDATTTTMDFSTVTETSIFNTEYNTDPTEANITVTPVAATGITRAMATESSTETSKISTYIVKTTNSSEEPTTTTTVAASIAKTATERTTVVTEISTMTESTAEESQDVPPIEDVTLFVRIIFEGSWADVCSVFPALRQYLATLLTEGTDKTVLPKYIIFYQTQCGDTTATESTLTPVLVYVVDSEGNFDSTMTELLPSLYKSSPMPFPLVIHSFLLVQESDSGNAIAVVVVSSVALICLVLLAGLLFIMRKRQTRFSYGERCRPVSLDAYSLDSVSAYNSGRRKGVLIRASKRSYGNPTFEDSSVTPSHPLNFAGIASFCNESNTIAEEFANIPQVSARIDELPIGAEVKNRYANVVPLPETRVPLQKINNDPTTEYINASYVRGPKNATKYYVACQAPIESTVTDFWRMIWEQQSKVIIMLTDIVENGVERCVEYIPPSEVTDCHRLYGDYQVTLKKREAKEKYAISTLHLKNLENNTFREVSHIWYLWPTNGVPSDATGLIAVLLEARALQRGAPGPIVVHCSPGTGRTGTLIALDLAIRQYEITRTVDVPRVVYTIRRDRAGAVQTKEQYIFIYKALNLYAAKLAGGALESM